MGSAEGCREERGGSGFGRANALFSVQAAPTKSNGEGRVVGRSVGMKTRKQGQALRAGLRPTGAAGGPIMCGSV